MTWKSINCFGALEGNPKYKHENCKYGPPKHCDCHCHPLDVNKENNSMKLPKQPIVHTKHHQMAIYVDYTKSSKKESFQERTNRLVAGSVNLPNTMKADVFLLTDKVGTQIEPGKPVDFQAAGVGAPSLNEKAAVDHAAAMGYVGFLILRPVTK